MTGSGARKGPFNSICATKGIKMYAVWQVKVVDSKENRTFWITCNSERRAKDEASRWNGTHMCSATYARVW